MDQQHVLNAIPVAAVCIGPDDRIIALNPQGRAMFGDVVVGRNFITVFRQPSLLEAIETAQGHGRARHGQHAAMREGRQRVYDVLITPMGDEFGTILTFEDVTAMEQAGEMRSEFVANVSHELRTPLTAISGFIETLRGPARDDIEARDQFLEIMERETRRMHRLVDDLLSLAKVEEMEGLRPTEPVDIAELLTGTVRNFESVAGKQGVTIALRGCDTPAFAPADGDQLTQVFANLLENALKYGSTGRTVRTGSTGNTGSTGSTGSTESTVTVTLTRVDNDPRLRGPGLLVSVADEGEGIDERHLGRLTERFYRVDSHRSRGMGGTGLGLAIVKHILNRHRGRLRITSQLGEGSRFEVALPTG